jgi:small subunit ribosomal protein S8
MVNDPIADFIQRLKGGSAVKKEAVTMPYSNLKYAIAEKLRERGFVKAVEKKGKTGKMLEVSLMYSTNGRPKITDVKRISKPGRRLYAQAKEITTVKHGHGLMVLSTPKGILAGDEARKQNIGGETLFSIW